jgi:hypothetical protein
MAKVALLALSLLITGCFVSGCGLHGWNADTTSLNDSAIETQEDGDGIVCKAVCDKIKLGMTEDEVNTIVGRKADYRPGQGSCSLHEDYWLGKNATIIVFFDLDKAPTTNGVQTMKVIGTQFWAINLSSNWSLTTPDNWPGAVSKANFDRLEVGMPVKHVQALMGREPEMRVGVTGGEFMIWRDRDTFIWADFLGSLGLTSATLDDGSTIMESVREDRFYGALLSEDKRNVLHAMDHVVYEVLPKAGAGTQITKHLYDSITLNMTKSEIERLMTSHALCVAPCAKDAWLRGDNHCWVGPDGLINIHYDGGGDAIWYVTYWNPDAFQAACDRSAKRPHFCDIANNWAKLKIGMTAIEVYSILGSEGIWQRYQQNQKETCRQCWFDDEMTFTVEYSSAGTVCRLTTGYGTRTFRSMQCRAPGAKISKP